MARTLNLRPAVFEAPKKTQGDGPPSGGDGLPVMVWLAIALCMVLAISSIWLVAEVSSSQESLSSSAAWWEDMKILRSRLKHMETSLFEEYPEPPMNEQMSSEFLTDLQDPTLAARAPYTYAEHGSVSDQWREKSRMLLKTWDYLMQSKDEARRGGVEVASQDLREVLDRAADIGSNVVIARSRDLNNLRARLNLLAALAVMTAILLAFSILRARKQEYASSEELRRSEERYRQMFAQVNVAQMLVDPTSNTIVDANPAACQFYGQTLSQLKDRSVRELWDGDDPSMPAVMPSPNTASTAMQRHRLSGGHVRDVEVHSAPVRLGQRTLLFSIIRDVTERHQAEVAMVQSERRFRTLAENVPGATYLQLNDEARTMVYVSEHMDTITGISAQAFLDGTAKLEDLCYPGQARSIEAQRWDAVEERRPFFVVYRVAHRDGGFRWVEEHGQGIYDDDGVLQYLQGTIFDVTGRRRAKEALATEKERLAVTLRSIADGVISTDTDGLVELMNEAAEAMLGCRQEDAIGRPLAAHYAMQDEASGRAAPPPLDKWLDDRAQAPFTQSVVQLRDDAPDRTLAVSGSPLRTHDGDIMGAVVVLRDITEERALEGEMQRAAKLESVGVLAGGIAHDFNNILSGVIGNLSLARMDIDADSEAAYSLKQAQDAAVRAQTLTRQLLTFSKGGAPLRKRASLSKCIEETTLFALRGSNVRCDPDVAEDLIEVNVDEGQINQVLHNLVLNAAQAMPEGGTLEVEAKNVMIGQDARIGLAPGQYMSVRITDEGVGIPEEAQQRIFDPYFTTKENGTGLGLATSYSIMRKHDGALTMDSTVGVGTTFHIYLPVAGDEPEYIAPAPVVNDDRGELANGYILLMDDELTVRDVCGRMLRAMGHQVAFAIDGEQALELYAHAVGKKTPFDLVIMDLTVPGAMGGKEATRRLTDLDPDVQVIVSSGYSNDPIMSEPRNHGFCGVLRKPYTREDLAEVLSRHLRVQRAKNPLTTKQ